MLYRRVLLGLGAAGVGTTSYFLDKSPLTGKRRLILWGENVDIYIGQITSENLHTQYKERILYESSIEHQLVKYLSHSIVQEIPIKRDWNVTVIDDPSVNAFVTPDGSIFVFKGLLDIVDSIDELGFILAHECSHVYLRHSANQLSTRGILSVIVMLFQLWLFGDIYNTSMAENLLIILPMSRKCELEADKYALILESKLGLRLEGASSMMSKLKKYELRTELLSTHPLSDHRVKEIIATTMKLKDETTPHDYEVLRLKIAVATKLFEKYEKIRNKR
ncbi:unnamed protein product [Blepharisma stoltei]|uniref:Peptidase M48 domain-containing protein n=1 Tax=Blepharisma stoltei TaxID=1481888 RepID=A0AAU9IDM9_9CILI|nr:unnamed protein product [Blepharisma stoltei]